MMEYENRESGRKGALTLLDYVVIDESGAPIDRAMARTLNVSERGILLETHLPLDKGQLLLITIGLEDNLCEIRGKIVRAEKCGDDSFCYGVEFFDLEDRDAVTLKKFLEDFKENSEQTT